MQPGIANPNEIRSQSAKESRESHHENTQLSTPLRGAKTHEENTQQ
jgi:hypothetical protein